VEAPSLERRKALKQQFVKILPTLRKASDLTQKELGTFVGHARQTISNFERGVEVPTKTSILAMLYIFTCEAYNGNKLVDKLLQLAPIDYLKFLREEK
jgi:DNA-binding XRE family transcriptional regulator